MSEQQDISGKGKGGGSGKGKGRGGKGKGKGKGGRGGRGGEPAPPEVDPEEAERRAQRAARFGLPGASAAAPDPDAQEAARRLEEMHLEQPPEPPAQPAKGGRGGRGAGGGRGAQMQVMARPQQPAAPQQPPVDLRQQLQQQRAPPPQPSAPAATDLESLVHRLYTSLVPPKEVERRDEQVRQRLEATLRRRWRDVSVSIYGSAASGLRVGASSDVDLCATFPKLHAEGERLHSWLRSAEAALVAAEAATPEATALMAQVAAASKGLKGLRGPSREREGKRERLLEKLRAADGGEAQLAEALETVAKEAAREEAQEAEAAAEPAGGPAEEEGAEGEEGEEGEDEAKAEAGAPPEGRGGGGDRAGGGRGRSRKPDGEPAWWLASELVAVEAALRDDRRQIARLERHEGDAAAALALPSHRAALAAVGRARDEVERVRAELEVQKKIGYAVGNLLRSGGYDAVEPVVRARTPVVKCVDPRALNTGGPLHGLHGDVAPLACDVVVNNQLALHNSALIRRYTAAAPCVRPLCLLVKSWASRRSINKAAAGTLSSYAHVLSVVHFLQAACEPPLLPDLTHPRAVPDEAAVAARAAPAGGGGGTLYGFVRSCDGLDVRFCTDPAAAWRAMGGGDGDGGGGPAASAAPPLSVLLRRYFEYMAAVHDRRRHQTLAVRSRGGTAPACYYLDRAAAWPKATNAPFRVSIEDPFETFDSPDPTRRHDVAATVSVGGAERLRREWGRAAELLRRAEAAGPVAEAEALLDELMEPHSPERSQHAPRQRYQGGGGGGKGRSGGGGGRRR